MGEATLQDWVGRSQTLADVLTPAPARALAATLNRLDLLELAPGDAIQPLWIWLSFLPLAPASQIGTDGHPRRGGFLPPIDLPRRMWAGSRCRFHAPLRLGAAVERTSTIAKISEKAGKAGSMVFVTVSSRHDRRRRAGDGGGAGHRLPAHPRALLPARTHAASAVRLAGGRCGGPQCSCSASRR